jgi:hypothetical protein
MQASCDSSTVVLVTLRLRCGLIAEQHRQAVDCTRVSQRPQHLLVLAGGGSLPWFVLCACIWHLRAVINKLVIKLLPW